MTAAVGDDRGSGGGVATYRGDVGAGDLGWTLTHEHLFVLSPELDRDHPHPEWDAESAVHEAVATLERLHDLGVRTVVDLTVPGLGRDAALVARVAERVRVNLVASTGWYADQVLPLFFRTHGPGRLVGGPDPLEQIFLSDVREGIGDTGVRAGMLKVVTDEPGMTRDVLRVMEAAASVHRETGVPVTTHSNPRVANGPEQARFLLRRGVSPTSLVIGHSGDSRDLAYLRELLDLGVTLGLDRFGMAHAGDDEGRIATLKELLARGHAEQLLLSHDSAVFSRVTPPSWRRKHSPHWSPEHLSRCVLPRLLAEGVSEEQLETMMLRNPARLLAPATVGAAA